MTTHGLTPEEQEVLKIPGQFYRALEALPQLHPADLEEAAFHVHALGRIVAMRAAHRAHPDLVPNKAGTTLRLLELVTLNHRRASPGPDRTAATSRQRQSRWS